MRNAVSWACRLHPRGGLILSGRLPRGAGRYFPGEAMSDAITIVSGPGEMWQPTGELRWRQRWVDVSAQGAGETITITKRRYTILQQRWASDAGAYEWRDVPTVEG